MLLAGLVMGVVCLGGRRQRREALFQKERLSPTSTVSWARIQIKMGDHYYPKFGGERWSNDRSVRGVRVEFLLLLARLCSVV